MSLMLGTSTRSTLLHLGLGLFISTCVQLFANEFDAGYLYKVYTVAPWARAIHINMCATTC